MFMELPIFASPDEPFYQRHEAFAGLFDVAYGTFYLHYAMIACTLHPFFFGINLIYIAMFAMRRWHAQKLYVEVETWIAGWEVLDLNRKLHEQGHAFSFKNMRDAREALPKLLSAE